jgi:hypothetical protein
MEYTLEFVQGETVEAGTINDTSPWGGTNPARTDRANILLLSQNDKSGVRTYLSIVNTDPLNAITWTFSSAKDAWHQATLLVFKKWDSVTAYTANNNAVYYVTTGKFYKCIQNNTNVAPDSGSGSANWEEITDFTLIQQGYTNVDVTDYDFAVESRLSLDIADKLHETLGEKFLCKFQPEEAVNLLNLIATREGFRSKFIDEEPDQGEEIIRAMEAALD